MELPHSNDLFNIRGLTGLGVGIQFGAGVEIDMTFRTDEVVCETDRDE